MNAKYLDKNQIGMSGWSVKDKAGKLLVRGALERTAPDPYAGEAGRECLREIGEAWFVSYMFYEKIDKGHYGWARGAKWSSRLTYEESRHRHHEWLAGIVRNPPRDLGNNKMGLSAKEVIAMARQLLEKGY